MSFDISIVTPVLTGLTKLESNPNTEVAYVAKQTIVYVNALASGAITGAEYTDLMAGLQVDQMVASTALEQEALSGLSSILTDLKGVIASVINANLP
jgi:hypothetical protein